MKLSEFIVNLQAQGESSFSTEQALTVLSVSKKALSMSLNRMRKKQALVTLHKDFHLIVPPEYRKIGCLPPEQFIPLFMQHLATPYYACLLSAALYHGASHQKPQIFQVMVSKRMRTIVCGQIKIIFIIKNDLSTTPTQSINVPTGYLIISTPESTAMDLLLYPRQSGGLSHIATVLTELIEVLDPDKLLALAESSGENAWVQRLGFLLEKIEPYECKEKRDQCINLLKSFIQRVNPVFTPLSRKKVAGYPRDYDWKIIINTEIESDI